MMVAIDYDDTITRDEALFRDIINLLKAKNYEVAIVTRRNMDTSDNSELEALAFSLGVQVIYTEGLQKSSVCEALGLQPDIWVDDSPELIGNAQVTGAAYTAAVVNQNKLQATVEKNRRSKPSTPTPRRGRRGMSGCWGM